MKKESPETVKRRLMEEQERLAEYANEEIVIATSTVDVRAQLRSMFRALPFGGGLGVGEEGVSGGGTEDGRVSLIESRPSVIVERARAISFHQIVELMEHCMFELEEEEVEAEEEQRRVQESLGEVDLGFTSPRTNRKHVFRDLTILQDGEERKEKLVEKAIDSKDNEDNSNNGASSSSSSLHTPSSSSASTTATTHTTANTESGGGGEKGGGEIHEKTAAETAQEKHEKHEKMERARMTLMHRTASGGTLLPNKEGEEGTDMRKGRAMALAPRARRQTQAIEPGQPASPTTPTASRILNVASSTLGGLAAMKAAMEEKAKLYRPPGQKAKTLPAGAHAAGNAHDSTSTDNAANTTTAISETTNSPATDTSTTATTTAASPGEPALGSVSSTNNTEATASTANNEASTKIEASTISSSTNDSALGISEPAVSPTSAQDSISTSTTTTANADPAATTTSSSTTSADELTSSAAIISSEA